MNPSDRKYTRTHEWVKIENGLAVIGITDHAQEALGDITFVELPAVGRRVEAGGECGVVESVKAASDIFAPVGGVVAETNASLSGKPELVNDDPYGAGWFFKLRDVREEDADGLLDAAAYERELP